MMEDRGDRVKILKRKGKKRDEYSEGKERKDGAKERKGEKGNSRYW
jgi:hypothetical protein